MFSLKLLSALYHALMCLSGLAWLGLPLESRATHVTGRRPWCPLLLLLLVQLLALICTTWCMHQLHQTPAFRHDTCAEILTCLTRVAFAIGVTRLSSSLSSLPLAPLASKPHALPLILNPHSNAHRYFSLCKKKAKGAADQAAKQGSSYEETVVAASAQGARMADCFRCQDGRCRLFQPPLPPSALLATDTLALGADSRVSVGALYLTGH